MATELGFTYELMLVLGAAAVGGYGVSRLGQPVLLGYLASGVAIGPLGFKLITDTVNIQHLAGLGVAFLLFALGVQFSLEERLVSLVMLGKGREFNKIQFYSCCGRAT